MADEARAEALRRAVSTACPERVRVQTRPGSPEGGGSLVPEWVGVAWLVRVRWLRAGQAKRCVERAESRALGVGTGVREESRRQRAGASLERVAGVGEEERPAWMECARCLHGGTSAGLAVGARETRVVAVGAAEWAEHERAGGSWAVARVGSVRGAREPAGEEGVTDGVSVQGASLASGRGVSRARRGVDVGWLSSAVCWL